METQALGHIEKPSTYWVSWPLWSLGQLVMRVNQVQGVAAIQGTAWGQPSSHPPRWRFDAQLWQRQVRDPDNRHRRNRQPSRARCRLNEYRRGSRLRPECTDQQVTKQEPPNESSRGPFHFFRPHAYSTFMRMPRSANPRAQWCRANDVQTRTERRARHPLQHVS
jgi:hypothetical protein